MYFTKLLLLNFLQMSLLLWIVALKEMSKSNQDKHHWPLNSEYFERYIKDFLYYERIIENARDLKDAIEYVLLNLTAVTNKLCSSFKSEFAGKHR